MHLNFADHACLGPQRGPLRARLRARRARSGMDVISHAPPRSQSTASGWITSMPLNRGRFRHIGRNLSSGRHHQLQTGRPTPRWAATTDALLGPGISLDRVNCVRAYELLLGFASDPIARAGPYFEMWMFDDYFDFVKSAVVGIVRRVTSVLSRKYVNKVWRFCRGWNRRLRSRRKAGANGCNVERKNRSCPPVPSRFEMNRGESRAA